MSDWENSINTISTMVFSIGGIVAAFYLLFNSGKLVFSLGNIVNSSWQKVLNPFLQLALVILTLIIPNGVIIGYLLYQVAFFYWKNQSLDFIITNQLVFTVGLHTVFVSLYSFLWTKFLFPRIRDLKQHKFTKQKQ